MESAGLVPVPWESPSEIVDPLKGRFVSESLGSASSIVGRIRSLKETEGNTALVRAPSLWERIVLALAWASLHRTLGMGMLGWGVEQIYWVSFGIKTGVWSTHSGEAGEGGIDILPCARGGVEWPDT